MLCLQRSARVRTRVQSPSTGSASRRAGRRCGGWGVFSWQEPLDGCRRYTSYADEQRVFPHFLREWCADFDGFLVPLPKELAAARVHEYHTVEHTLCRFPELRMDVVLFGSQFNESAREEHFLLGGLCSCPCDCRLETVRARIVCVIEDGDSLLGTHGECVIGGGVFRYCLRYVSVAHSEGAGRCNGQEHVRHVLCAPLFPLSAQCRRFSSRALRRRHYLC